MTMLNKPITAALLLAGAAGGPYMLYETDAGQAARATASQAFGGSAASSNASSPPNGSTSSWYSPSTSAEGQSGAEPTLTVTQINSLAEVLRFDIPPAWVMQHFPTVNTGVGDLQLDGLRVPLITGTRPDDLVGTLTYYFDRFQRVQRISLHAVTAIRHDWALKSNATIACNNNRHSAVDSTQPHGTEAQPASCTSHPQLSSQPISRTRASLSFLRSINPASSTASAPKLNHSSKPVSRLIAGSDEQRAASSE